MIFSGAPFLAAGALLALVCGAAQSQDFAYRIELRIPGNRSVYRAVLPPEVHRGAVRADFADLRVVNGAGEPVPFALIRGAASVPLAVERQTLPLFPVYRAAAKASGGIDLRVRQRPDGTLVSLSSSPPRRGAGGESEVAYWLVDASRLIRPAAGLQLEWKAIDGLAAALRVEGSDDLMNWRLLTDRAPLLSLRFGGEALLQDRAELPASRARYLRLGIDAQGGPRPELIAVHASLTPDAVETPRQQVVVAGKPAAVPGEKPGGDIEFDLGGAFAIERVAFSLPQVNTLAPVEVLARKQPGDAWQAVTRTVVFRLAPKTAGGDEIKSPPLAVPPTTARYWLLRADPRSGGVGSGEVRIHADYAARHVVFVARGAQPFSIEYGQRVRAGERDVREGAALALDTLLPGYRRGDEWQLTEAQAGAVATINAAAVEKTVATEFDLKKTTLWAILVAAVLVLGTMAYRMTRG